MLITTTGGFAADPGKVNQVITERAGPKREKRAAAASEPSSGQRPRFMC